MFFDVWLILERVRRGLAVTVLSVLAKMTNAPRPHLFQHFNGGRQIVSCGLAVSALRENPTTV